MHNGCSICTHNDRAEIENALLNLTSKDTVSDFSIDHIAEQYDLSLDELKMHALFHTPLIGDADLEKLEQSTNEPIPTNTSLTRRMKLREADILATINNEYLVTLKAMGRRINKLASISSIDEEDELNKTMLAKLLTKPMVDLYVGLGSEIRQTVKTMAEVDRLLNGPEDGVNSGLAALAAAIRGSEPND